jgi:hypothetical protein
LVNVENKNLHDQFVDSDVGWTQLISWIQPCPYWSSCFRRAIRSKELLTGPDKNLKRIVCYFFSYINPFRPIVLNIVGWFHGTCDTFTLTFTKSFETFRVCAIIISKTFLPLDRSYTTFCWRALVQIPSTLRNYSLKYILLFNPRSFALLYAIEILMIDSDSSSSGLSESICFEFFWIYLRMVGLWKPFR